MALRIFERTPKKCFDAFKATVSSVIAATLSNDAHVRVAHVVGRELGDLGFSSNDGTLGLKSRYGSIRFFLGQNLVAAKSSLGRYQLKTAKYSYKLYFEDEESAAIRWDYQSPRLPQERPNTYCRNHMHIDIGRSVGVGMLDFDKLHTPTGWVTFESMIRFLIADLGVRPASDNWVSILEDSEKKFKNG